MISINGLDALSVFFLSAFLALFYLLLIYFWRSFSNPRRSHDLRVHTLEQKLPAPSSESTSFKDILTPRELEISRHVAQGKSNAEIARDLQISESTVESHLKHIFQKLNVHSRMQLAHMTHTLKE